MKIAKLWNATGMDRRSNFQNKQVIFFIPDKQEALKVKCGRIC